MIINACCTRNKEHQITHEVNIRVLAIESNRLCASRPYGAPPPQMIEGEFIFSAWVSNATKMFP